MYCPKCGTENIPTDLRCLRCGTSLISDQVGGSAKLRSLTSEMDQKVYGGIASFLGFFLVAGLLNTVFADLRLGNTAIYGSAVFAALVFGAIGRYIARQKH
jgi:zinc-ribbon domain